MLDRLVAVDGIVPPMRPPHSSENERDVVSDDGGPIEHDLIKSALLVNIVVASVAIVAADNPKSGETIVVTYAGAG